MYQAKSVGRNNFQWFTQRMLKQAEETVVLSTALWRAAKHQELRSFYQPEISHKGGSVTGMEALARWPNALDGAAVTPNRFITITEETGLILHLCEGCCVPPAGIARR